ncbi:LPS assembly protein LptD [Mergibacter septicus]|uniref:LPS assembly protein LptD n=1 Tax=Mergibacter septicus TaxID=221402 RepID=UPI0028114E57|nr:LPS assembly protein LptD [Mergibacter septicus]WMR96599.1 LPS assembly protein LptD [Mergibacter septicus]
MKKQLSTFLTFAISGALYANQAKADLQQQCLLGVPHFTGTVIDADPNSLPIYIDADKAQLTQPQGFYQGKVIVEQGNKKLTTDYLELTQIKLKNGDLQRTATIQGDFDYQDNLILFKGKNAKFNLNTQDTEVGQSSYHLVDRQGRGSAEQAKLSSGLRILKNASFTSCLPNDNAWKIKASEMTQHIKEEYVDLWNAVFYVKDVPVFYFPYLQFPIGDKRRSGLLIPTIGSSNKSGYYYAQPIYWNIAPNYDLTLIPKYMTKNGLQLQAETRYLNMLGNGLIAGEYLKHDRLSTNNTNRPRYLFYWKNNGSLAHNWRFKIDYTKVSDKNYFTDFSSPYGNSTDGYAVQNFETSYYQPNYRLSISATQFQLFENINVSPYYTLPKINFNYYRDNLFTSPINFSLFSQAVQFKNNKIEMPTAWRFHFEPSLTLPLVSNYGRANIETKLYTTHYQQKKGQATTATDIAKTVNRVVPEVKIDLSTVLTSDQLLNTGYIQTLEPQVQYLYRPYRDQSKIGNFDSVLLQQDYYSLFNDRRYSGLDRIASANQVSLGFTTRFYDAQANERLNLSLGQIYYLKPARIDDNPKNNTQEKISSWSIQSNWKINDQWNWYGSYQYDPQLHETSLINSALEYRPRKNNLIQIGYRYASQKYIDQNFSKGFNQYRQRIQQLGLVTGWQINDNWAVVGHYYQDLAIKKPVEQYLGVQYSSCCWSFDIGFQRNLTAPPENQNPHKVYYNRSFGITFRLTGFGNNNSNIPKMLETGIIPYHNQFSRY